MNEETERELQRLEQLVVQEESQGDQPISSTSINLTGASQTIIFEPNSNEWSWNVSSGETYPYIVGVDPIQTIDEEELRESASQMVSFFENPSLGLEQQEQERRLLEEIEKAEKPKPKRKRKVKELPIFSHEEMKGEVKSLPLSSIQIARGNSTIGLASMCPYTDLIPIDYLKLGPVSYYNNSYAIPDNLLGPFTIRKNYGRLREKFERPAILSVIMRISLLNHRLDKELTFVKQQLDDYLQFDENVSINRIYSGYIRGTFYDIEKAISTGACGSFSMKSYRGFTGSYSLYMNNSAGSKLPEVLLVTVPENYMYHKYNIVLKGQVDLSKCILLVNRELDNTSFPNKNFRALYKKYLEPIIKNSELDVFKVPQEFMIEKCFVPQFSLESKNIQERKKEIEDLSRTFVKKLVDGTA